MDKRFKQDESKRMQYLKIISQNKKEYQNKQKLINATNILSIILIAVILCSVILLSIYSKLTSALIITTILSIFVYLSLFISRQITSHKSVYEYAYPYSSRMNAELRLTNEYLVYEFWKTTKTEFICKKANTFDIKDRFVYKIKRSNIKQITIDEFNICRITGYGTITKPEWALKCNIGETNRTSKCKDFSFITAFAENNINEILKKYKQK